MEKEDTEFVNTLKDEIRKRRAIDMLTNDRTQDNRGYAYMGMNVSEGDIDIEWDELDGRGVTDSML
jgi:hypothetical protein